MDMMSCPHCGAANSRKRAVCYQCEGDLHAPPPRAAQPAAVTCGRCGQAARAAPPGQFMARDHIWCTYRGAPVLPTAPADTCFQEGFGWGREQIMD